MPKLHRRLTVYLDPVLIRAFRIEAYVRETTVGEMIEKMARKDRKLMDRAKNKNVAEA